MEEDKVFKKVETIESDLAFDRSRIDKLIIRLDGIESILKSIQDRLPRLENKFQDALQIALQPLVDEVKQSTTKKTKLSFWKKLNLRGGE
jgi:hypothetical protein